METHSEQVPDVIDAQATPSMLCVCDLGQKQLHIQLVVSTLAVINTTIALLGGVCLSTF